MTTGTPAEWGKEGLPLSLGFYAIIPVHATSDTLSLTHEARSTWKYERVAQSLGISDSVLVAQARPVSASSTIALTQSALRVIEASFTHAMTMDSIGFYINLVDDRKPVGTVINLTQTLLSISASAPVSHVLSMTDSAVGVGPHKRSIDHWMAISQYLPTPHFLYISDALSLTQLLPTPLYAAAIDTIAIVDVASITNIAHALNLAQVALVAKLYALSQDLGISHSNILTSDWVRRVDQDIPIGHALTYFRDEPCDRKNYTPFQGDNTVNTVFEKPPSVIPPSFEDATVDRLVLYYPSRAAIAKQLTLRAPEFSDRDRNSYTRITRETRGGSLVVYADPQWPSLRSIAVTVQGLTAAEADEYLEFMYTSLGKTIQVRDWDGGLWEGVITNPENPVTQDGPGCKYTISFDLEGKKFETDNPTNEENAAGFVLNLSDQASVVKV